eukprot:gene36993-44222_t
MPSETVSAMVPIHQLLRMGRGAVIGLDARESEEVEVYANNVPVALGHVVLRGDKIGIQISEVLFRNPASRPREQAASNRQRVHGFRSHRPARRGAVRGKGVTIAALTPGWKIKVGEMPSGDGSGLN